MNPTRLPVCQTALLSLCCACATSPDGAESVPGVAPRCGAPLERCGDEIVVCGQFFHTGTPVVLWLDPGGYDAYRVEPRFSTGKPTGPDEPRGARYGTLRKNLPDEVAAEVRARGWTLEALRRHVDQFVLHYDVCGTSRRCFKVLQDMRGLSVHFLLDVDGTIYQTLDLKERGWHAGVANDRSVGIEIAHIGAYPTPDHDVLEEWYERDSAGIRVRFPERIGELGIATPGFIARPARGELIDGAIHGQRLYQYDFTAEQYEALARLIATLHEALPGIALDYPRDSRGQLRRDVLSQEERAAFGGILGHWHVTTRKIDPGPALDWDWLLQRARELLGGAAQ